jgi:hypothetical protein
MSPGERKASVDVFWCSKEGFEMHLQVGGTTSVEVLDEAQEAVEKIIEAGGQARPSSDHGGGEQAAGKENPPKCSVCGKKMVYREGEGRTGKPYKGFFCPERDCEGKPVWLDS